MHSHAFREAWRSARMPCIYRSTGTNLVNTAQSATHKNLSACLPAGQLAMAARTRRDASMLLTSRTRNDTHSSVQAAFVDVTSIFNWLYGSIKYGHGLGKILDTFTAQPTAHCLEQLAAVRQCLGAVHYTPLQAFITSCRQLAHHPLPPAVPIPPISPQNPERYLAAVNPDRDHLTKQK